ncbi:DUF4412 domain-containing protein [Anseongella ginsenosidimutans]|nr:DUF4412 domain-containing protein [Anseongella ginsenosidimutans]
MRNNLSFKAIALAAMLLCCLNATAQTNFEGTVEYGVQVEAKDLSPEMQSMMPREFTIYLKDPHTRLEIQTAMSEIIVLGDNEKNSAVTLMSILGNKMAVKTDSAQVNEALEQLGAYEIRYIDEKKEILGYDCRKALIIREASSDTSELWYTKELLPVYVPGNQFLPKGDWFPMQVHSKQNGVNTTITVQSIDQGPLEESLFEIPEGYKMIEQDAVRQALMGL